MKDEIMQRLTAVLSALNNVSVSGRQNLTNLSGSMAILEETIGILRAADIVPTVHEEPEEPERR